MAPLIGIHVSKVVIFAGMAWISYLIDMNKSVLTGEERSFSSSNWSVMPTGRSD